MTPAAAGSYSLLRRLSVAFTLIAIGVLSLAGGLLYHSLSAQLTQRDDDEISNKLADFLAEAHTLGSSRAVMAHAGMFRHQMLSHPAITFAILDARGNELANSPRPGPGFAPVARGKPMPAHPYYCSPQADPSRCIFSQETLPSGEPVRIELVHAASERESVLGEYRDTVWLVLLAGSILMGLLGYAITRRGLGPVRRIGQRISRIEAHNLGERLDTDAAPVELHDIAVPVNRMLDRLERAFTNLSQFSSDLAHDMRTPLAVIINASQVTLTRKRFAEEYETLIASNIEECERLQRMIEKMLFLARADHAQQPLKPAELDVRAEFARLSSYFEAVAENKGNRFVIEGAAHVRADAIMFRRAVSNLVSNALDHATSGSDITLRTYRSEGEVAVAVTNQGQGIAPVHIGRIFDRFYRINAARQDSARNMGLGLAIVKSIMELHRGRVEVVSHAGSTTFTLYFPDAATTSEPTDKAQRAQLTASGSPALT